VPAGSKALFNTPAPLGRDSVAGGRSYTIQCHGPVFDAWEADFGRTYALGSDPHKQRLIADLAGVFARGKELRHQLAVGNRCLS
jgi:hypothetical protein